MSHQLKLRNYHTLMKEEFELVAKTFHGLEEVLAKELTELGASNIEIGNRMVAFTGDKALMYKANFCLRTHPYPETYQAFQGEQRRRSV